jgi:hypothetical protein
VTGTTARVRLQDIASCFEGTIPSPICTCSLEGIPNVTYLSIVHRIDDDHVALTVQFFNKTRRNVLENPRAQVIVVAPETLDQYRLDLTFERTEIRGQIFERARSHLEAIASQTGMSEVMFLRGVDIYRVLDCHPLIAQATQSLEQSDQDGFGRLNQYVSCLDACRHLDELITAALEQLAGIYGYDHSFLMVPDEADARLYTVASRGFPASGVGSEVVIGEGLIGVAAARRLPVRCTNFVREQTLSRAVRDTLAKTGDEARLDREIPLPGLPQAMSHLVIPLVAHGRLVGVLCLQSATPGRFVSSDESAMKVAGHQLALSMAMLGAGDTGTEPGHAPRHAAVDTASTATIKYYRSDDSIFIDDAYVIKGIPGRILHKLIQIYLAEGRQQFTNKEIRLDASLKLPDIKDNLEARLILLRRRLEERCDFLGVTRTGRGRLELAVARRLKLETLP